MRRWVYAHLPKWLQERDFEVFCGFLCILAGLPLLFGEIEPKSLEAQLPYWLIKGWATALTLGGFLTLLGILKASTNSNAANILGWRRMEAYGLTCLCYAGYTYGFLLLTFDWRAAFLSAMITIIFALTCHSREIAVQLEIIEFRLALGLSHERL
jgi:hypothetical protein